MVQFAPAGPPPGLHCQPGVLAATSVRDFSVQEIAASLAQAPSLLETTLRDIPARQRQFEAVFDFSWRLLSDEEKAILPRLAVFQGGFTKETARIVTGASPLILTRLRYKSLIRADGSGRFSMHTLLRQITAQRLGAVPGDTRAVQRRHADHFLGRVTAVSPRLVTADAAETAQRLRRELDNIRAAWESAVARLDFAAIRQSAAALTAFFIHVGLDIEMEKRLAEAITVLDPVDSAAGSDLGLLLRLLLLDVRRDFRPITLFEADYADFMTRLGSWQHPDRALYEAMATYYYAYALTVGDDAKKAVALCERALRMAYRVDDPIHLAYVLCQRAYFHHRYSELAEALQALNTAHGLFQEAGHLKGLSLVAYRLAPAYVEHGNYWQALVHDRRALALYQALGYARKIPKGHQGVGFSYIILGNYQQARRHFYKSIALDREIGFELGVIGNLGGWPKLPTWKTG